MKIVALSDTHGHHRSLKVPPGDILVHGGDITRQGELEDVRDFNRWLGELPHAHKVVIAGNHDFCFERRPDEARAVLSNGTYLQDEGVQISGLNLWGSPWQPWFYDWAFNLQRGDPLRAKWKLIPENTDLLITHGPPLGRCDKTSTGQEAGCADLLEAVHRTRPSYHVFGHIHEAAGIIRGKNTTYLNASSCDLSYRPTNQPLTFEITPGGADS